MKTLLCFFLVSAIGIISQENEGHSVAPWILTGSGATISMAATLIFSPNTQVPSLKPSVPEKTSPRPIPLITPMAPEPIPQNESMVITVDHEKIIRNNVEEIKENSHIKTTMYQDAITKNIVKNTIIIYRQWKKTYHQEVPMISMATPVAPSTISKPTPVAKTMANGVLPTMPVVPVLTNENLKSTPVVPVLTNEKLKESPSIKSLSKKKSKKTQENHWVLKPISVNNPTAQVNYGHGEANTNPITMAIDANHDATAVPKKTMDNLGENLKAPTSYENFPETLEKHVPKQLSLEAVDKVIDGPHNTRTNPISTGQPWEKKAIMNNIWAAFNYVHQKAMGDLFFNLIPGVL